LVTASIPNNGHYQWSVPENMASYEKCRFRYTVYAETDSVSSITSEGFFIIGEPVFSEETQNKVPEEFALYQNYPNPFNPSTKIKYSIPPVGTQRAVSVQLKVFDILGNEVATLVDEFKPAGSYEVEFNSNSDGGRNLSSGIYFYQLVIRGPVRKDSYGETNSPEEQAEQTMIQTRKMVFIK